MLCDSTLAGVEEKDGEMAHERHGGLMEDSFVCERFHCKMRKIRCIERQEYRYKKRVGRGQKKVTIYKFPECRNCWQGKGMMKGG